jgi:hypothetical protein
MDSAPGISSAPTASWCASGAWNCEHGVVWRRTRTAPTGAQGLCGAASSAPGAARHTTQHPAKPGPVLVTHAPVGPLEAGLQVCLAACVHTVPHRAAAAVSVSVMHTCQQDAVTVSELHGPGVLEFSTTRATPTPRLPSRSPLSPVTQIRAAATHA